MKKYLCGLLVSAAVALPAYAASPVEENQEDHGTMIVTMVEQNLFNPLAMPAACTAVKLDDTQKASLREAYFEYSKMRNTLIANIKNSWLDVRHTFMSKDSSKTEGMNTMMTAKSAENALFDAMSMLSVKVFYDILKPEQREPGWMCMMAISMMKKQKMLREMCAKLPPPLPNKPSSVH